MTARQSVAARSTARATSADPRAPTARRRQVSARGVARALRDGALLLGLALAVARGLGLVWPVGYDAHSYWAADLDNLYAIRVAGQQDFFPYSPAMAQLFEPFRSLPFEQFLGLWTAVLVVALVFLAGPLTPLIVLFEPVWLELVVGNLNLLIGAAIVLGFRYPAAWSFVFITKLTPGVGVLWFAVRREWRSLAVALGATAVVVGVSIVAAPALWADWFDVLRANGTAGAPSEAPVGVPLMARLPVALALVVWAARGNHRWGLPVAALLASPVMWISTFSLLVASLPLVDRTEIRRLLGATRASATRRLRPSAESARSAG